MMIPELARYRPLSSSILNQKKHQHSFQWRLSSDLSTNNKNNNQTDDMSKMTISQACQFLDSFRDMIEQQQLPDQDEQVMALLMEAVRQILVLEDDDDDETSDFQNNVYENNNNKTLLHHARIILPVLQTPLSQSTMRQWHMDLVLPVFLEYFSSSLQTLQLVNGHWSTETNDNPVFLLQHCIQRHKSNDGNQEEQFEIDANDDDDDNYPYHPSYPNLVELHLNQIYWNHIQPIMTFAHQRRDLRHVAIHFSTLNQEFWEYFDHGQHMVPIARQLSICIGMVTAFSASWTPGPTEAMPPQTFAERIGFRLCEDPIETMIKYGQ